MNKNHNNWVHTWLLHTCALGLGTVGAFGLSLVMFFFLVADTKLSSGQPAYGVRGDPGPEYMYNMNWETCSFMRVRHVAMHGTLSGGHEATETGLAYAPVSQAHGHNHIVQCVSCCTAAQTSSVPHHVVVDCALALVLWTLRSARTHHPPTVPVSL